MNDEITPEETPETSVPKPPRPPKPPVPAPPEPAPVVEVESGPDEYSEPVGASASGPKSPVGAALLSLAPFGLGHLYLGQYVRALGVFAGFWASILLGWPFVMIGIFFYFFGIFDAYRQAQLINLAAAEGHELPASVFRGGLAIGVFFIVLGGVLISKRWFDFYIVREFLRDWWPVLLVLLGAYFIYGAIRENRDRSALDESD